MEKINNLSFQGRRRIVYFAGGLMVKQSTMLQWWFSRSIGQHTYLMGLHIEYIQTIMAPAEENEEHEGIDFFKEMQTPLVSYVIASLDHGFDSSVG